MPRPRKCRHLQHHPTDRFYKPQAIKMRDLQTHVLSHDGLEALRLADYEGMEQSKAAASMNISRPTFSRLVNEARHIVAMALIQGDALKIEGGDYAIQQPKEKGEE